MTGYLVRRVGQAIAVVIGVMIVTFILIHMEPGSAARAALGAKATTGRIAIFNRAYGLNQPLWDQFGTYVRQIFEGNLGYSYTQQQPVSTLIEQRLPRDIVLLGTSTVLAVLIAIPMGIFQAVRRNKATDFTLTGVSFTLYAMPDYLLALLLIALFAVQFHWLPPNVPSTTSVGGLLADPKALVLPVITLTLVSVASFSRYQRSSAIEVLAQEYIRVARSKGMPSRLILLRHVLRNSMLPVVTLIGLTIPSIIGGAVIAEEVFNFPGMGLLFFQAATMHDFPILLGSTLFVGVATVAGSLLADIAYAALDPRVRYGRT
ncbi:MAG TPA: ABC transporter permease [Streptosporangiaceae bacterium]|nr:ABC transporter permease [Streptosporangiaceae bacterium]